MSVCATYDPDCYGCRLREKGMMLSASAIPNRQNKVPGARANPQWEKGIVGEHRSDGSFMPVIRPGSPLTTPLQVKEYSENRYKFDEAIRRAHQGADIT